VNRVGRSELVQSLIQCLLLLLLLLLFLRRPRGSKGHSAMPTIRHWVEECGDQRSESR